MSDDNLSTTPPPAKSPRLNEDWLATLFGLGLLLAALVGLIPAGLIP